MLHTGACPCAPPLEIENLKKVIRANFKLFHLYFATFVVGNIVFYETELFSSSYHILTFFLIFFYKSHIIFFINMILAPPPLRGAHWVSSHPHAPRYPTGFIIKAFNYRYWSIVSTSYQHQINEDLMNI